MTAKDIISHLEFFGLDEIDSRIYMGLLQLGSVSVGNMAAKLEIDRGKAYRSLSKLKNLGIVSTTFSNPTICTAIEPKTALTEIIEQKEDEITTMKNLAKKIHNSLDTINRKTDSPSISTLSIIQGRSNIYSRIGKLLQNASNTVYIVSTIEDLGMMYHTSIPEKISIAKQNGVSVRILTMLEDETTLSMVYRLNASEIRLGKLPSKSRMVVEKQTSLLMSGGLSNVVNLKDENDSVLFANSSEMVDNMFSLCDLLWKKSKKIELTVTPKSKKNV